MCEVKNRHDYSADVKREVGAAGNKMHALLSSDGNGSLKITKNTSVALSLVILLVGGVVGFFTATVIPAVRIQEQLRSHLQSDQAQMTDHENRLRELAAQVSLNSLSHQAQHQTESRVVTRQLSEMEVLLADMSARLKTVEKAVVK